MIVRVAQKNLIYSGFFFKRDEITNGLFVSLGDV